MASYGRWQEWLRANRPRLLVLWGRYDTSFQVAEAEAYRSDVPDAEVYVLDGGHFVMDTRADEVASLVRGFASAGG
ncbi:alpha/beta fold hydrolase [Micromonospora sp. URMC 103]|uniref:alpha/beta fold hydrolase n=1 Tax=Micromonospora sp. URMC 103 TaxID=3423406 RepID=UPI003F1CA3DC